MASWALTVRCPTSWTTPQSSASAAAPYAGRPERSEHEGFAAKIATKNLPKITRPGGSTTGEKDGEVRALKGLKRLMGSGLFALQNVHKLMGCEVAFGNVLVDTSASKTTHMDNQGSARGAGPGKGALGRRARRRILKRLTWPRFFTAAPTSSLALVSFLHCLLLY
jgi:hypothetical protein